MDMRYSWQNIRNTGTEYPEIYLTTTAFGDKIRVDINRAKGLVKLNLKTHDGKEIESVIRNGLILRERNISEKKCYDFLNEFSKHHRDISSLPDTQILRIIGGNYNVLTEFFGTAQRIYLEEPSFKRWFQNLFTQYRLKLRTIPYRIKRFFRDITGHLSLWDIFDAGIITGVAYISHITAYDYLFTGVVTCMTALLSGVFDWSLRQRAPYLVKIFLTFFPGIYAMYLGYTLQ